MNSNADFHLHTTCSDGVLSPTELVDLAAQRGVKIIAITDHDITDGIDEAIEAASKYPGVMIVPGVELSCDVPNDEVHVLGHFIDYRDEEFQATLRRFRETRWERGRLMVEKLNAMGLSISWERVQEFAGDGAVGRPHIAQALLERGYVSTITEAFDRYIGRNSPAYVEREKLTPVDAVRFINRVGGLATLAHPRDLKNLDDVLTEMKAAGLAGMEVYYQDYDEATIQRLLAAARRHGLVPLGGSDYHGLSGHFLRLPGEIPLPDGPVEEYMALARQRRRDLSK